MVETDIIELKNGAAMGIKVSLHGAPLLVIRAEKGFLGCGYFDSKVLEKFGCCAVVVRGVRNFHDMLAAKPAYVSKAAKKLGVTKQMTGKAALEKMV